jgi:hypothetical protein
MEAVCVATSANANSNIEDEISEEISSTLPHAQLLLQAGG